MSNVVFQVELGDRAGKYLVSRVKEFSHERTERCARYSSEWLAHFAEGIREAFPDQYGDIPRLDDRDNRTLERYLLGEQEVAAHFVKQSGDFDRYVIFESIWDAAIALFCLNKYNIGAAFYSTGSEGQIHTQSMKLLGKKVAIATPDPEFAVEVEIMLDLAKPDILWLKGVPDELARIGWTIYKLEFYCMNELLAMWDESSVAMSREAKVEVEVPARREQLVQVIRRNVPGYFAEKHLLEHATLSDQIKPLQRMLDALLRTFSPMDRVRFWRWAVMCVPELSEEEKFMPEAILGLLEGSPS